MATAACSPAPARTVNPLHLWHLWSLDAPAVAIVWTLALGHAAGVALPWHAVAAIGLAVWLIYAADRLLDARSAGTRRTSLRERHSFAATHQAAFLAVAVAAVGVMAALLVYDQRFSTRRCLSGNIALGAGLALYFVAEHFLPRRWLPRWTPLKNSAMAALFAAAVALPALQLRAPQSAVAAEAAALALLCWLNCRLIAAWEGEEPALRIPRAAVVPAALFAATAVVVTHAALGATIALAVALLFALDARRKPLSQLTLRALADLVLLTPALTLLR